MTQNRRLKSNRKWENGKKKKNKFISNDWIFHPVDNNFPKFRVDLSNGKNWKIAFDRQKKYMRIRNPTVAVLCGVGLCVYFYLSFPNFPEYMPESTLRRIEENIPKNYHFSRLFFFNVFNKYSFHLPPHGSCSRMYTCTVNT